MAPGSSSDLVPTLLGIFDSMIAAQKATPTPAPASASAKSRTFPVLRIVEPGDVDADPPGRSEIKSSFHFFFFFLTKKKLKNYCRAMKSYIDIENDSIEERRGLSVRGDRCPFECQRLLAPLTVYAKVYANVMQIARRLWRRFGQGGAPLRVVPLDRVVVVGDVVVVVVVVVFGGGGGGDGRRRDVGREPGRLGSADARRPRPRRPHRRRPRTRLESTGPTEFFWVLTSLIGFY